MNRILSAILALQLALLAALYWPRSSGPVSAGALLAEMAGDALRRISIEGGDAQSVTLSRDADSAPWQLASGLPADESKVAALLDALTERDSGFAIADSAGAAARFQLGDDAFERRIRLANADTERAVYLGSSPSFRKIHARREGESAVYVLELNNYDAPTTENDWLDRSLLALRNIDALTLYSIDFELGSEGWTRGDGGAVDAAAMETLVQALASLRVSARVKDGDEDAAAAEESLRLDVRSGDTDARLTLFEHSDSEADIERYYLSSDRYAGVFDTSAYDAERLLEAARSLAGLPAAEDESDNAALAVDAIDEEGAVEDTTDDTITDPSSEP